MNCFHCGQPVSVICHDDECERLHGTGWVSTKPERDAAAKSRAEERAAVLHWLHSVQPGESVAELADQIEAGEHVKAEVR